MSRLSTQAVADASGPAAPLFAAISRSLGKVPNAYATVGSNSPVALEAALHLEGALARSTLSAREREVIKLVVSEVAGCDYCLAAHTAMSKKIGLDGAAIVAARHGKPSGDLRLDSLARFVRALVDSRGTVPVAMVDAVKAAGFSDAQIVDTLLTIASITFTNLLNRVNDTELDFPAAD
jgi:uncharacterized peroxidase-related enzyme